MFRCIELAKNGLGLTAPNPMVGCVIVKDNTIISEGYTSPYGGAHAEVNAINAVKDKSLLLNATLYVTLEPCAHYGKTPPCVNLILKHKIPEVVIGIEDPNEKVAGKSIQLLKKSGCKVTVGVLKNKCREHHKRFLSYQEKKRPYIILKWAVTKNGFIAPTEDLRDSSPQPFWISNTYAKQLVHQWRAEEQAILVGTNTVLADNPKLNIRTWEGKNPVRLVIDRKLKIPKDSHIFDASVRTIIITNTHDVDKQVKGIDYELTEFKNLAQEICTILYKHEINSVIIEGGTKTLQSFINDGLWDEARIFTGDAFFSEGILAPKISGTQKSTKKLLNNTLTVLTND